MRALFVAVLAAAVAGVAVIQPAHASAPPYPNSMASTGDSITRAFDINWLHLLSDSPQYSWSTGTDSSVNSEYQRLLRVNSAIGGHEYNDAKTGAKMKDLDGQVTTAASQGVQYLTILMGANDLCTSSISTMTPTATFQAEFQTALTDFFNADPSASVYVSSLPNIYQLWYTLHTNSSARSAWSLYGICQSMLSSSNTETQRQQVVTQEVADNTALQTVCNSFAASGYHCLWDNLAGYNFKFPASDISTVDYFHPNIQGQNAIANVTWAAGYWPAAP
jgi:lysophospholipase L1-like esterase